MLIRSELTIVAPATTPGTGAITIIRISGPQAFSVCDAVVALRHGKVVDAEGYSVHYGTVYSGRDVLDEVLVTVFRAPHSYTGEDSVEISCHASPYIASELLRLLVDAGASYAEPGEFTQRAFLNGKMDLAQAEAVADVISSTSSAAHRVALNQLRGGFSSELQQMRGELLDMASLMELELDFSEEDVEFADRTRLSSLLDSVLSHVKRLTDSFRLGNAVKNGVPVAIVGAANAGKSTLLNALLGEDRAIVSDIAGTTRDTIEETFNLDGVLFRFIDTAGLRESSDIVERIGIERTFKKISEADIVLCVLDLASDSVDLLNNVKTLAHAVDFEKQKVVFLLNKADFVGDKVLNKNVSVLNDFVSCLDFQIDTLVMSAKTGMGLDHLKKLLVDFEKDLVSNTDSTLITNLRHYEALTHAASALQAVRSGLATSLPTDLVAEDLRTALAALSEILGSSITPQETLENIFKNFCIGK